MPQTNPLESFRVDHLKVFYLGTSFLVGSIMVRIYISIVFLIITSHTAINAQFKIDVVSSKTSYFVGEYIDLGVALVNTGQQSFDPESLYKWLSIEFFDSSGQKVSRGGFNFSPLYFGEKNLAPREEAYTAFVLNDFYGIPYRGGEQYLTPGKYTFKVASRRRDNSKDESSVSFFVFSPTGEEESVRSRMVDLIEGADSGRYTKAECVSGLAILYETFPKSVYRPVLHEILETRYRLWENDYEKARQWSKEFVELFPSLVRGRAKVKILLSQLSSKSDRINFLEKVRMKAKGSLMEKIIDNLISEESQKSD